jgi:hypothetical protein
MFLLRWLATACVSLVCKARSCKNIVVINYD